VTFSPQANYTDWATATCRRNLVPTFVYRGVSRGQRSGSPMVVNLSFLDRSRYFSFKSLLIYPFKVWVDPVPDLLLLRKSGSAGDRTRDLWFSSNEVWSLDHRRSQRTYRGSNIILKNNSNGPSLMVSLQTRCKVAISRHVRSVGWTATGLRSQVV
jgi:hypothetical protein